MASHITIAGRTMGPGHPCFVIAEAGINHNGDLHVASDLVHAASEAGADAIKFQTHFPEHEMLRGGATAAYVGESLFDLLTRTALSRDAHFELRNRARENGLLFLSTPFSREAADFLETVGVPAYKTGSARFDGAEGARGAGPRHPRHRARARRDQEDSAGRAGGARHGAAQRRVDPRHRRRRDDRTRRCVGQAAGYWDSRASARRSDRARRQNRDCQGSADPPGTAGVSLKSEV